MGNVLPRDLFLHQLSSKQVLIAFSGTESGLTLRHNNLPIMKSVVELKKKRLTAPGLSLIRHSFYKQLQNLMSFNEWH